MLTDAPPKKANREGFLESDRVKTLDLPQDGRLLAITKSMESAMKSGTTVDVRRACTEFLETASEFYAGSGLLGMIASKLSRECIGVRQQSIARKVGGWRLNAQRHRDGRSHMRPRPPPECNQDRPRASL